MTNPKLTPADLADIRKFADSSTTLPIGANTVRQLCDALEQAWGVLRKIVHGMRPDGLWPMLQDDDVGVPFRFCALCNVCDDVSAEPANVIHDPDCPWLAARRIVGE